MIITADLCEGQCSWLGSKPEILTSLQNG